MFAIEMGSQCFTNKEAHLTYAKYGKNLRFGGCMFGKGGVWAMDVYKIASK